MRTNIELPPVNFKIANRKEQKTERRAAGFKLAWALLLSGSLAVGAVLGVMI